MFNRKDNLLACKTYATQNAADCDFALLISLNRYVVGDLPLTNGANGQYACGSSNTVLFRLMQLAFRVLYAGPCSRLHTQANTRGNTRVVGYAVGY
jgi:hypothetical protein